MFLLLIAVAAAYGGFLFLYRVELEVAKKNPIPADANIVFVENEKRRIALDIKQQHLDVRQNSQLI